MNIINDVTEYQELFLRPNLMICTFYAYSKCVHVIIAWVFGIRLFPSKIAMELTFSHD